MLVFEDEELHHYLTDKEVGYGDKLDRLVSLLGDSKVSIINRIKSLKNMTQSSRDLFESVIYILDKEICGDEYPDEHKIKTWKKHMPVLPPELDGGSLSTEYKTESYGLVDELHTLVTRVGIVRTGYVLEKLGKVYNGKVTTTA